MTALRTPANILRAGFLALLLLGACVKPMLASVCDVHAIAHALTTGGPTTPRVTDATSSEHDVDRDHASGKHGSLHGSDDGGAYAHIVAEVVLPDVHFAQVRIPGPVAVTLPLKRVGAPYRPPIV